MTITISAYKRGTWGSDGGGGRTQTQNFGLQHHAVSEINRPISISRCAWSVLNGTECNTNTASMGVTMVQGSSCGDGSELDHKWQGTRGAELRLRTKDR